jgi:hypothetical protein
MVEMTNSAGFEFFTNPSSIGGFEYITEGINNEL